MVNFDQFFTKTKRFSTSEDVRPTKKVSVGGIVSDSSNFQTGAKIEIIVPKVENNEQVTFNMLAMIQGGNNSHEAVKLFAELIEKDPNSGEVNIYCQVFDNYTKTVCNHNLNFKDNAYYFSNRSETIKKHLEKVHPQVDISKFTPQPEHLCSWSGVKGIE